MDIATLVLVFLSAIAVSGCIVLTFSNPIDGVLSRLMSGEMAAAWSRFAKFGLLVASLTSGLRLKELESLVNASSNAAQTSLKAGGGLVEIYKTIAGTMTGAAWTLLAFFGASLVVYAGLHVYEALRPAVSRSNERHGAVPAGRY